jgi:predicted TIM-barrel fold metal-dependent hydrolase
MPTDHLCKPALSSTAPDPQWVKALEALSSDENVFMKLSGALNEFSTPTPSSIPDMLSALKPYTDIIFALFPNRVMFGSDWPVCNVGGPAGENGNWGFWRDVVDAVLEERGMSEEEREGVWCGVGEGCYRVEM